MLMSNSDKDENKKVVLAQQGNTVSGRSYRQQPWQAFKLF